MLPKCRCVHVVMLAGSADVFFWESAVQPDYKTNGECRDFNYQSSKVGEAVATGLSVTLILIFIVLPVCIVILACVCSYYCCCRQQQQIVIQQNAGTGSVTETNRIHPQGFNQGDFNQGGFPQQGFNPGGFPQGIQVPAAGPGKD